MVIRLAQGEGLDKRWVGLADIAPDLRRAVIASEDAKFCAHRGFDFEAIRRAFERLGGKGQLRGASTISMQVSKNVFLWPGRDFLRKGLEAWLTVLLETLWSKHRILEVYLNVAEWGPGLYGAEAASRHWFAKPAAALTRRESALLAAVLPNPREWSPARPSARVAHKAGVIEGRMRQVGPGCASFPSARE
ncbi:MAG: monofunctional biosynthetic peptidoglycan transglycosylase [Alphaproteobacteria bacterium]|nr:monofunctional biosynthetic peptidoglycan transglycosylase [Alphaproteobacteria bacterium]